MSSKTAPVKRVEWVDSAKGIGIILVVFGHAWRGVFEAGLIPDRAVFQSVDDLVYAFHMPLFFFLSGLFFAGGLMRQKPVRFVWQRAVRLVYPLVLWTYLFAATKALAGSLANSPEGFGALMQPPLPPLWHFWFLWALFVIQLACLLLRPLLATVPEQTWPVWAGALAVAILIYFGPLSAGAAPWFFGAVTNGPYFMLGALLGSLVLPPARPWMALPALAVFAGALAASTGIERGAASILLVAGVATLSLSAAIAAIEAHPAAHRALAGLRYIGRISMAIFLAHTIFSAGFRIVLIKLGIDDLVPHIITGVGVGLVGPWILYLVARRLGLLKLAGF